MAQMKLDDKFFFEAKKRPNIKGQVMVKNGVDPPLHKVTASLDVLWSNSWS